ncbi:MAG TPA: winged helix-turn-helix domain-containing protein [Bryobacteraceae bacterium]|jgi:DNA-binding winged helix-turn-helix (wHTH) protein/Tol biopolymer transport system component|nr:winged helix-turn-helix domain-containing protein [Bryobacteraceae bacterium]
MPRFSFGPFLLDVESRALLRDGQPLAIAARTLDTLAVLVQNRGRLLDKDELLSLIWPGTVVDEANLSQSVFTLRKVLGDSRKDQHYIATIAGRGYQFVAPVTELATETPTQIDTGLNVPLQADPVSPIKRSRIRRWQYVAGAVIAFLLAAGGIFRFVANRHAHAPSELVERRLTYNSSASDVDSAVISPDGKYLAYSDTAGIHVRLLSTGEERLIPASAVAPPGAFSWVDSWFPNGTELLGHSREAGGRGGVWAISILGQAARELRADSIGWSVSPDGSHIAFSPTVADRHLPEIWVMDEHGEHAHKVLGLSSSEFLWSVRWSPSGQRLAYISMSTQGPGDSLETCDLKGANRTVVLKAPGKVQWARSLWWLPDDRIIYSQAEAADVEANLWQIRMNTPAGTPAGKPKRITHWAGVDVKSLSASADGTKLVVRKESYPSQVYIGAVAEGTKRLRPPERLTNDEAADWATAWTRDSKAVLFTSNRGGKWGIFKQEIAQDTAQPLIGGRENANLARLSPDGAWVLYSEASLVPGGRSRGYRLMRLPVNGGPPRVVYETTEANLDDYACAQAPASLCVAIEEDHDSKRLTVSALDPVHGKGRLLKTISKKFGEGFACALSPDGSTLAMAKGDEPKIDIRLVSLTGGADQEIAVKGWPNIGSMEWSSDGKGLYCGSLTSKSATLLYVDLKGSAQVVSRSSEVGGGAFIAAVPSPDGRYLAMTGSLLYSNAWLLEGF